MTPPIKVAVVVPVWNNAKDLPRLLMSLKGQKLKSVVLTVIIVDNFSSDDSAKVVKEGFPKAIIIRNDQNLGLAGGNNIGIKKAINLSQDAIVVLNADTLAEPNLIENLVKGFQRHPNSLLSPKIYFSSGREFYKDRYKQSDKGKVIWYAGGQNDWDNVIASHRGVNEVDTGQYNKEIQTDFATGCCFLIPSNIAKQTKGFDPDLYLYYEDNDLSQRVKKLGGEIWYIPSAKLWHVNAGSSGVGSGLHDNFIARNRLIFGLRWAPLRAKIALIRQSFKLLLFGRKWEKRGIIDFYLHRFGRGSF